MILVRAILAALLVVFVTATPALTGDHLWMIKHIPPTGKCTTGKEVRTTFYGSGHRTANGERFNPNGNTAASWDYPFGTVLSLTNPHNGRSEQVRINDRGPAKHLYRMGFPLDIAYGAAKRLHLGQNGRFESGYLCVSVVSLGTGAMVAFDAQGNQFRAPRKGKARRHVKADQVPMRTPDIINR